MRFDLHLHTWYSDGRLSPIEVVQECKEVGLEIISLTDHENVDGIPEAKEASEKLGIRLIPGIEFTASHRKEEYHILGYFINYRDPELRVFLDKWHQTKITQIEKILKNLEKFGFKISFEEVLAEVRGSIGRSHIVWAVFRSPEKIKENLKIFEKWEIKNQRDFFKKFLLEAPRGEGLAYEARAKPKVKEVIDLIHKLGGMVFWAHPFWRTKDISKIRKSVLCFREGGLDGVEVCYPFFTKEQTLSLHQIAQEFSICESGGSDFHGEGDDIRGIGNFQIPGFRLNFPFNFKT